MENIVSFSLSEKNWEIQENDYVKHRQTDVLKEIAEQILRSEVIEGSEIDFHNFVVDLAKLHQYELACQVLDRGISIYSNSVDLLADYLIYGRDFEGARQQSEKYYERLQTIPDRLWTWRGYEFSLEHLKSKRLRTNSREDITKIEDDIEQLIQAYYYKFPDEELPYLAEANLYSGINPEKEWKIIKKALSRLGNCPRCTIRYAELLLYRSSDLKEYKRVVENLQYEKLQSIGDLDYGFAQFLRGLCLIRLLNRKTYKDRAKIEEIYKCFQIAQKDDGLRVKGSDINVIKKQIRMLVALSDIEYREA